MTRTDGNRRVSANEPGAPQPLPRWTDRRDTRGYLPDDWYAPDPDAEYEARYETDSSGKGMDND